MTNCKSKFIKVRCNDCDSEQIIYDRASTTVYCQVCSSTLAEPAGGKANIKGKIVEVIDKEK